MCNAHSMHGTLHSADYAPLCALCPLHIALYTPFLAHGALHRSHGAHCADAPRTLLGKHCAEQCTLFFLLTPH